MEINKGLAKINLQKFDLLKNSTLTELFGELQDHCSDTDENLTQFKKFKMIVTQINIFKELTESSDHSNTIMALIRKIETLGLDNTTAKWAVKLVADALSIKNNLTLNSPVKQVSAPVKNTLNVAKPNKQALNTKKIPPKNIKSKSNQSKSTYIPQPKSASPSYSAPKSGYAKKAPAYKSSNIDKLSLFYNSTALISILLSVGGLIFRVQNPLAGTNFITAYSVIIIVSLILSIFSYSDYHYFAAIVHSISLLLYIYSLLLLLGMGYVYSGVAILSVFIMLLGISVMISDASFDFGPWSTLLFGLLLLNLSLVEGDILTGNTPFITTGILGLIAALTSSIGYSEYEEGYGTLNGLFFFATLVQFVFLFF